MFTITLNFVCAFWVLVNRFEGSYFLEQSNPLPSSGIYLVSSVSYILLRKPNPNVVPVIQTHWREPKSLTTLLTAFVYKTIYFRYRL